MTQIKPTVYVVDDEESVRSSLSWLLGAVDIPVRTFPSAEAFLAVVEETTAGLLLLDVRMPGGMSGLEFLEQHYPNPCAMPVIVLTAHADVPMAVQAMKTGARSILEKPVQPESLIRIAREVLEEESYEARNRLERIDLVERLDTLTPREREVMDLLLEGRTNRDVGLALGISPRTVEVHRSRILGKTMTEGVTDLLYQLTRHSINT